MTYMSFDVIPEQPPQQPPHRHSAPQSPRLAVLATVAVVAVVVFGGGGYLLTRHHEAKSSAIPPPVALPVTPITPVTLPATKPVTPSNPAAAAFNRAVAAELGQPSVRVRSVSSARGRTLRMTQTDQATSGVQRLSTRGARSVVRVIGPDTYFEANAAGLVTEYGFPRGQAAKVAGHWIHLTAGSPGYGQVTEGVTLPSVVKETQLAGHLSLLTARRRDGRREFGIRGTPVGDGSPAHTIATLWIPTGSRDLPAELDEHGRHGEVSVTTFSGWGGRAATVATPGISAQA
jgi:hypothetical protein